MHHGFYDPKSSIRKTRLQAQIDMIETTIEFAGITDIKSAVDVGCGIGGSSRYRSTPCCKMQCPLLEHLMRNLTDTYILTNSFYALLCLEKSCMSMLPSRRLTWFA